MLCKLHARLEAAGLASAMLDQEWMSEAAEGLAKGSEGNAGKLRSVLVFLVATKNSRQQHQPEYDAKEGGWRHQAHKEKT
jgi:hypothetical protein